MMDGQQMITLDYQNKLRIDLKCLKFNDWENDAEAEQFYAAAYKIKIAINDWLRRLDNVETVAVDGVNIKGSNFSISILSPEDTAPFDGRFTPIELYSKDTHVATFFLDWNETVEFSNCVEQIVLIENVKA